MARLSIYVPDPLLERVRAIDDSGNMSQVIQRALERLVAEEERAPLYKSGRPADAQERLERVRDKLTAEARGEYERGYTDALSGAEILPWSALEGFASGGFDVARWSVGWRNALEDQELGRNRLPEGATVPVWVVKLADSLGSLLNPICDWTPQGSYLRGFNDAWRDVWNSVEHGEGADSGAGASHRDEGGAEM